MEMLTCADLKKMNKEEIIGRFLQLQLDANSIVNELSSKIDQLNGNVGELNKRLDIVESSLSVSRNVNDHLSSKVSNLEREFHKLEQYSRRECLEFVGIPVAVKQESLMETVIRILDKVDIACGENDIEACHRVRGNRTIVKFSSRRMSSSILNVKKRLYNKKFDDLNFPDKTSIYINESLCPYYRGLWNKCKNLWLNKKIHSFWTINGTVKYKKCEDDQPVPVFHDNDLEELLRGMDH